MVPPGLLSRAFTPAPRSAPRPSSSACRGRRRRRKGTPCNALIAAHSLKPFTWCHRCQRWREENVKFFFILSCYVKLQISAPPLLRATTTSQCHYASTPCLITPIHFTPPVYYTTSVSLVQFNTFNNYKTIPLSHHMYTFAISLAILQDLDIDFHSAPTHCHQAFLTARASGVFSRGPVALMEVSDAEAAGVKFSNNSASSHYCNKRI